MLHRQKDHTFSARIRESGRVRIGRKKQAIVSPARTKERVVGRQRRRHSAVSNEPTDDESYEEPAGATNPRGADDDDDDDSRVPFIDVCCFCLCFRSRQQR
ncbi:hypothetical protein BV22DRAFT_1028478 [Leucogyrophana mollusca]|uniref:Uncharacterized protein n=1 Tax=Leucogyrophana mollusca TaxID=85980 RepID=A0ACB8BZZ9_9AGAM|nr:hypothetical protein BV22DRAFT_1028478 [Leucogyrophana mollusca]